MEWHGVGIYQYTHMHVHYTITFTIYNWTDPSPLKKIHFMRILDNEGPHHETRSRLLIMRVLLSSPLFVSAVMHMQVLWQRFLIHVLTFPTLSQTWRLCKGFLIVLIKYVKFVCFALYGIWIDLAACKILLRGVPVICLQF